MRWRSSAGWGTSAPSRRSGPRTGRTRPILPGTRSRVWATAPRTRRRGSSPAGSRMGASPAVNRADSRPGSCAGLPRRRILGFEALLSEAPGGLVQALEDGPEQPLELLDAPVRAHVHLVVELTAQVGVGALAVVADQEEARDEDRLDREDDAQEAEGILVEARHHRDDPRVDGYPDHEPDGVHGQEVGRADEGRDAVGDPLVPSAHGGELLAHEAEPAERLPAVGARAEDGVAWVRPAAGGAGDRLAHRGRLPRVGCRRRVVRDAG